MAGLYRGFGAVVVGGTPGTVIYLCSYEWFKGDSDDFLVHFGAGMLAETVACVVYVPVDVVKERMQVRKEYTSSWHALKTIANSEGVRGIYRGYGATLGSFGPFSALYFMFYEQCKKMARRAYSVDEQLPFEAVLMCSATAGGAASWLTSPLDMAKLRLQIQRMGHSEEVTYRGVWDCLKHSYRQGGLPALFRGAGARVIHFAPATTITMTSYETCRGFFAEYM